MRPLRRPRVGLALGGGAARGLAHLGILRGLLAESIPVDLIVGTSMGSLIGGAYAALGKISEVERRMRSLLMSDEFRRNRLSFLLESRHRRGGLLYSMRSFVKRGVLYGASTLRTSFVTAEAFSKQIASVLPDVRIEALQLPFAAVALDLQNGDEIVLRTGSLRTAVAASSAIPGILPPVTWGRRLLVDGGWVDKVPVLPAYLAGADFVIAVDISADPLDMPDIARGVDIILRANQVRDHVLVRFMGDLADIVLEPAVRTVHWADFGAIDQCVSAGERAARAAAPRIRQAIQRRRWRSLMGRPIGRRLAERYLARGDVQLLT